MERLINIHDGTIPTPSNSLRFVCISDTHSKHFKIPPGDVLIHAGDFTKKGTQAEVWEFSSFLRQAPHKYKIIVAGNHDIPFDLKNYNYIVQRKAIKDTCDPFATKMLLKDFIYLEDSFVEIAGYKIWGSPWTVQHYIGAFTIKDKLKIAEKWDEVPAGIDILVTHSPPYGILDRSRDNKSVGCESLFKAVARVKPRVHVFGHIHEGHGFQILNDTAFINASICNNRYQPIYQPIAFDLPIRV